MILAIGHHTSNQIFKLRRYNGKGHFHTNRIEKESFYGFHIHQATEKYQDIGFKEEMYAVETKDYSDLHGAIKLMLKECNFVMPKEIAPELF